MRIKSPVIGIMAGDFLLFGGERMDGDSRRQKNDGQSTVGFASIDVLVLLSYAQHQCRWFNYS